MPLLNSYVIWNNKGGVGKTTLTFHMATQYAKRFPDRKVLVLDLCPQANVSMSLLGPRNNERGTSSRITECFEAQRTISFYLQKFSTPQTTTDPRAFLTNVSSFNSRMPPNIELLCGDMQLELIGRNMDHKRREDDAIGHIPWVFITSCVRYFLEGYENMQGITQNEEDWVVFIDTNPSFSIYTEMALLAAERLIIPINADDFSREAIVAMLDLVYGIDLHNIPTQFQHCKKRMFSHKAQEYDVRRPKIHLLINNRVTTYNLRSVAAFGDMATSSLSVLAAAYDNHSECFVPRPPTTSPSRNPLPAINHYFIDVQDFHTTGILSLYTGCPLDDLKGKVHLFSKVVDASKNQVATYIPILRALIEKL